MSLDVARSNLVRWRQHPGAFVREVFNVIPDKWQDDVLEAFPTQKRIAMKACKGPGKSTIEAWCVLNFLLTRPHPKIACTSISGDNLKDGLWTEIAKWMNRSHMLRQMFTWTGTRVFAKDHPETWYASARQWSKSADATQQADTMAGLHADYLLFVLDEAGGIPDSVAATAEAALSTGVETKLLLGGNPTLLSGPLYRACTTDRRYWFVVEVTGDPDDPKRSPRIDIEWARTQIATHGRENPWVLVNVFGQFPPAQDDVLLGVEEVALASRRLLDDAAFAYESRVMGVDVARQGSDRTVIFGRQGMMSFPPRILRLRDLMVVSTTVARAIERFKPRRVFIDETGLGAGVVDRVRELGHPVTGVQFGGGSAQTSPRCKNKRAEMWWNMAQWVKRGGVIPDNNELRGELVAPTHWYDDQGRVCLESKDDMKERGVPSPDIADALALTFAEFVPAAPLWEQHQEAAGVLIRPGPQQDFEPYANNPPSVHDWDPYADGRP